MSSEACKPRDATENRTGMVDSAVVHTTANTARLEIRAGQQLITAADPNFSDAHNDLAETKGAH